MIASERHKVIIDRLTIAFSPAFLEVIDDSEKHKGHIGAEGGAGHYTIKIKASCLDNLTRIEAHQKIYAALNDLIPTEIHALSIKILRTIP